MLGVLSSIFMGIPGKRAKISYKVGIRYPFEHIVVPGEAKLSSIFYLKGGRSLKFKSLTNFLTPHVLSKS